MVKIDGVTSAQRKMLDKMWSLDTQEEFDSWFSNLPAALKREARVLEELLIVATIDQEVEKTSEYPLAQRMLAQVLNK
jgi:uncharacterized protein YukE